MNKLNTLLLVIFSLFLISIIPSNNNNNNNNNYVLAQDNPPTSDNPKYCSKEILKGRACNRHDCRCRLCNTCECTVAPHTPQTDLDRQIVFDNGTCVHGSCGNPTGCWCSPYCNCCQVRSNCMQQCHCETCFEYCWDKSCEEYTEYSINKVTPDHSGINGGIQVTINGAHFSAQKSMKCRFGSVISADEARFVNDHEIICTVPAVTSPDHARVALSLDGGNTWTIDQVMFNYHAIDSCPNDASGQMCGGPDRGNCSATTNKCECAAGWGEEDCSFQLQSCPTNTDGVVCSGYGMCHETIVNGASVGLCVCESGYGGSACERSCSDCIHGSCDGAGSCICQHGYWGEKCNEACPADASGEMCSGHGYCISDGSCKCDHGYWGATCSDSCPLGLNNLTCSGHGGCDHYYGANCQCDSGWSGSLCDQRVCVAGCHGRGYCVNGECHCIEGLGASGRYCEYSIHGDGLTNHGYPIFEPSMYTVTEDAQLLSVTVKRFGGSSGAVTIEVHSDNTGTAKEGQDYKHVRQTLSWADGDVTDKHVLVQIIQDTIPESDETFDLIFTNPKGGMLMPSNNNHGYKASITILASDSHIIRGYTASMTVKVSILYKSLEESEVDRKKFQEDFIEDFAFIFRADKERLIVSSITPTLDPTTDHMSLVTLTILSEELALRPAALMKQIALAVKDPGHPIYDSRRKASKFIDIKYQPIFITSSSEVITPPEDPDSNQLSPATIRVRTIVVFSIFLGIGLFICGLYMYYHRVKVSEWILWKLGGFRFQKLRSVEENEKSVHAGDLANYHPDTQVSELELGEVNNFHHNNIPSDLTLSQWKKEQQEEKANNLYKKKIIDKIEREANNSRKNSQPELNTNNSNINENSSNIIPTELHDVSLGKPIHIVTNPNNKDEIDHTVPVRPLNTQQKLQQQKAIEQAKLLAKQNYEKYIQSSNTNNIPQPDNSPTNSNNKYERNVRIHSPINKKKLLKSQDEVIGLTTDDESNLHNNTTPTNNTNIGIINSKNNKVAPILDDGSAVQVERVTSSNTNDDDTQNEKASLTH